MVRQDSLVMVGLTGGGGALMIEAKTPMMISLIWRLISVGKMTKIVIKNFKNSSMSKIDFVFFHSTGTSFD